MPSEWRRGELVGSRGQGGTLPDKAITSFNTSAPPVISLYVCVCELLAWAGTVSNYHLPLISTTLAHLLISTFSTIHLKAGGSGRATHSNSPLWLPLPPSPLHDPPPAPEYWPKLSPWPAPLTPLGGRGSMARPKVQMIFLHLPPSCFPSELIANDNIRKGHNGDSTNNLPLGFAKLNICRSYKRVMDDCFVCVCSYFNVQAGTR